MFHHYLFPIALLTILPLVSQAQDLVQAFNVTSGTIAGTWKKTTAGIRVEPSKFARALLARSVPEDYTLEIEFTRVTGNDVVGIIIPVGNVSPTVEFSGWEGGSHGLSRVNGQPTRSPQNPTSVRPGVLENGKRYKASISVTSSKDPAEVSAILEGKELFNWKGQPSALQPNLVMFLPTPKAIGLAAQQSTVLFHKIRLIELPNPQPVQVTVTPPKTPTPPTPLTINPERNPGPPVNMDLTLLPRPNQAAWEIFKGAAFRRNPDGSIASVPSAGQGDRGAFVRSLNLSQGTIEVELKGALQPQSSFLGVVFHAQDATTYESIYFRPFNFASTDPVRRSHGVQYIAHPRFPWRTLRQQRPDEFEAEANPRPDGGDWFKAKVEITDKRVRVFLENSATPCMDVPKLNPNTSGKAGIWFNGIANWRNLKITPSRN